MLELLRSNQVTFIFAFLSIAFYVSFGYDLDRVDFIKLILLIAALFFSAYKIIQTGSSDFWLLAGLGIVFRLLFFGSIPNLSQDFYRFLWDGRLLVQGINPYLISPETYVQSGIEVVPQMQELYKGMGALNASHFSNYPPVNQLFFAIAALFSGKSILGSLIVLRSIMLAADVGILFIGRKLLVQLGLHPKKIFWYFLNPFIIIEMSGNLHFEGVMLLFLLGSLYLLHQGKWLMAATLFGVSISVKLIPLLFLPLLYPYFVKEGLFSKGFWRLKKFFWLVLLIVMVSFAPFISSEFVSNFATTIGLWFQVFEFNASVHYIIRWIAFEFVGWNLIETTGKILPVIVFIVVLILAFFRKNTTTQQLITSMLFAVSFYLLLSTTVHPWYVATPLLLSIFTRYQFSILWSLLVMLSYSAYTVAGVEENIWIIALEYVVVLGYLFWELFQHAANSQTPSEYLRNI
jgi:hypothetical protein